MRILWCASALAAPCEHPHELARSAMASHRYRVGYPSRALERTGHPSALLALDAPSSLPPGDFDCAVFGKITAEGPEPFMRVADAVEHALAELRARAVPIIVDFCDFQLAPGDPRGGVVRRLAERADLVTCNSREMASLLEAELHGTPPPVVIPDPVELERGEPRAPPALPAVRRSAPGALRRWLGREPARTLQLLWFGHLTNFGYLVRLAPALRALAADLRVELAVCSSAHPRVVEGVEALRREAGERLRVRFVEWRLETIADTLAASDVVLLPADPSDPAKRGAGSNRLVHALWAGRFAVAHPISSYRELDAYAWVGENLGDGVRWALGAPEQARRRIEAAQESIARTFSIDAVARCWLDAFVRVREASSRRPARS